MSRKHLVGSVAAAAVGLVLLSACGARPEQGTASAPIKVAAGAAAPATLNAVEIAGLGQVLTDQDGFTLYRFDEDTAKPPKSNCAADCAEQWPPVVADGTTQVNGVDANVVGEVARDDGTKQVTVGGWPVYRFAKDTTPGQATGQGVGEVWFAVTPTGGKAGASAPAAPAQVGVNGTDLPGFGAALTDQDGFTLYMFTNDSKDPSQSTCAGDCAVKWPPVIATGDVQVDGVDKAIVGTVARTDGSQQVTVGGWPVYRFAKDTAPGQTTGHGVGGTWFVIEPAGCKSLAPVQQPAAPAAPDAAPAPGVEGGGGY